MSPPTLTSSRGLSGGHGAYDGGNRPGSAARQLTFTARSVINLVTINDGQHSLTTVIHHLRSTPSLTRVLAIRITRVKITIPTKTV